MHTLEVESEDRETEVNEYEILAKKSERVSHAGGSSLRVGANVVVRIVRHDHPTNEDTRDSRHSHALC